MGTVAGPLSPPCPSVDVTCQSKVLGQGTVRTDKPCPLQIWQWLRAQALTDQCRASVIGSVEERLLEVSFEWLQHGLCKFSTLTLGTGLHRNKVVATSLLSFSSPGYPRWT